MRKKPNPVMVAAGLKAARTRRINAAWTAAHASEVASKNALRRFCLQRHWRVAFLEGPKKGPRTGIVDAVIFRVDRKDADRLEIRLVQLKGGGAGVTGREVGRLKAAAESAKTDWLIAWHDGRKLHMIPTLET